MKYKASELDTSAITDEAVMAELGRELSMRAIVYGQRLEAGTMDEAQAANQCGPMVKAYMLHRDAIALGIDLARMLQVMQRIEARGGVKRLALAYSLLDACEKNPQQFAAALGGEAAKMIMDAFPGAKIESVETGAKRAGEAA